MVFVHTVDTQRGVWTQLGYTSGYAAEISGNAVTTFEVPAGAGSGWVNGAAIDARGAPVISYGATVKRPNR